MYERSTQITMQVDEKGSDLNSEDVLLSKPIISLRFTWFSKHEIFFDEDNLQIYDSGQTEPLTEVDANLKKTAFLFLTFRFFLRTLRLFKER